MLNVAFSLADVHAVHPPVAVRPSAVDGRPLHLRVRLLVRGTHPRLLQELRSTAREGVRGNTHPSTLHYYKQILTFIIVDRDPNRI